MNTIALENEPAPPYTPSVNLTTPWRFVGIEWAAMVGGAVIGYFIMAGAAESDALAPLYMMGGAGFLVLLIGLILLVLLVGICFGLVAFLVALQRVFACRKHELFKATTNLIFVVLIGVLPPGVALLYILSELQLM